jgi:parallel beta-helix repeat protein
VFLQDQVGNVVSSPAGQVILVGCSQIIVKDQTLMDCSVGVLLCHTNLTTIVNNTCNNNDIGIYLDYSHRNTVSYNTCNYNRIGIYLYLSNNNTVSHNTCLSNTEHDIYLDDSDFNTVENNITTISKEFVYFVLLLIGFVGITLLCSGWRKVSARGVKDYIIVPTSYSISSWFSKRRVGHDEIIVPIRYRLASGFSKRRSLKRVDVDEPLEPDSSDQ